jgi:hypothetical protein
MSCTGEVDQSETFANRLMTRGVQFATIPAMTTSVEHFAAIPEPTTAPPPRATDND